MYIFLGCSVYRVTCISRDKKYCFVPVDCKTHCSDQQTVAGYGQTTLNPPMMMNFEFEVARSRVMYMYIC